MTTIFFIQVLNIILSCIFYRKYWICMLNARNILALSLPFLRLFTIFMICHTLKFLFLSHFYCLPLIFLYALRLLKWLKIFFIKNCCRFEYFWLSSVGRRIWIFSTYSSYSIFTQENWANKKIGLKLNLKKGFRRLISLYVWW